MGNLLRVLYSRENDSPNRVDVFVDFESKFTPRVSAGQRSRPGLKGGVVAVPLESLEKFQNF